MSNVYVADLKDLSIQSIPSSNRKTGNIPLKNLTYAKSNVQNFRRLRFERNGFETPEYNLYEIAAAEDADGIIRRAIQKKRALMNKEGYALTGKNPLTVSYIKQRFLQISLAQNQKMELLVKDISGDLVRYFNAFLKKVRNRDNSGGKPRVIKTRNGEKILEPVAAYFRIAPETMRVKTDKYGNPIKYMQMMPDGRFKEYNPEDIIHFKFNKRAGFVFSAPGLLPAIDDVRALRRIEENVELLIEQHLFPLFTLSIGSDEWPAEIYDDNTSEVDVWTQKIEELPMTGGLVVSHRHKFDILGYENALPVEKYLEHFKKRVYTAAGVSALDMGEGEGMNRSTADNASKILIDEVKDYQQEFKLQFEFEVIYELLLEQYNINVLQEENVVDFTWLEIDTESMIKKENHNAMMYNMNVITENENRLRNGNQIIDDEEERKGLYLYTVEEELLRMQEKYTPKTTEGSSGTKAASKSTKNSNTPSNQHGTKSGSENKKSSTQVIFSDIDVYDRDLTKLRVINRLFSLDFTKKSNKFEVYNLIPLVDELIDPTLDSLEDGKITPQLAKDIIIEKLKLYL